MHYHCEIWVKNDPTDNLEEIVARLMGPHEEDGGYWDWFVVGGRWTGAHDGYEPSDDIRNYSICRICGGTGNRGDWDEKDKQWAETCRGCNVCHGTGAELNFRNAHHKEDVLPLSKVRDKLDSFTLVIDGKKPKTFHEEKWTGKDFVKTSYTGSVKDFLKSKGITDGYLITVDYHC